jgi:hypothetical protein
MAWYFSTRSKRPEIYSGRTGLPSGSVDTFPESIQVTVAAVRSSLCRSCQALSMSTVVGIEEHRPAARMRLRIIRIVIRVLPPDQHRHALPAFPARESLIEAVYRDQVARLTAGAHELLAQLPPPAAL